MTRKYTSSTLTLSLALLAALFAWSCTEQPGGPDSLTSPEITVTPSVVIRDLAVVIEVQERHTPELMKTTGVVGTAVGIGADGEPVVKILAKDGLGTVPKVLEGVPVEVLHTGEYHAYEWGDVALTELPAVTTSPTPTANPLALVTPVSMLSPVAMLPPTARFPRPVPIGVSTGHPDITAGTIGARVKRGRRVLALSNNHVYADENQANKGDAVIQPGTFDGGTSPADDIGELVVYEPLVFGGACVNRIDAALAITNRKLVGKATPPEGYGTPRSSVRDATLGMAVKKFGRTTSLTFGTVVAINAVVNVGYSTGVACFTGQTIITPGSFSAGGDSGSLIVISGGSLNNTPVGLLYAGSASSTIANQIDEVLNRWGVRIDGSPSLSDAR
jgi:hypothetical protein